MQNSMKDSLTIAEEFIREIKKEEQRAFIMKLVPVVLLFILIIIFGLITPQFLTVSNLYSNILEQLSILLVTSMGTTFIILMGGIDLSIEGMVGFAGCFVGLLVQNSANNMDLGYVGILITILLSAAIGGGIGLIHTKLRLPTFIITFSAGYIAQGLGVLTYKGIPASILDQGIRDLYFVKAGGLPILTWIAFAVFAVALFLEKKTAFGRYIFAIGDNEKIPLMSGINVNKVKVLAFIWTGVCFGIAGVMGAAKLGTSQIYIGQDLLFPTLTTVVVGGTSMSGGQGGVVNTLIGVLIVTVLQNGMVMAGVPSSLQKGVQGVIIICVIILSRRRNRKQIVK